MSKNNAMGLLANQFGLKIVEDSNSSTSAETSTAGDDTPKTNSEPSISDEKPSKTVGSEEKDVEIPEDAPIGSIASIKSLYQGPEDSQGRAQWLDKYPEDVEEAAENEETDKYALIARKAKCFDGRKKFDISSIVVHSPDLKRVLGVVFKNYPGITCQVRSFLPSVVLPVPQYCCSSLYICNIMIIRTMR
jgi:hypothetical protein